MKKALILTTTSGFLSQFELNNVKLLQECGYQIHYATNFGVPVYEVKDQTLRDMGVILHHISIEKSPFKFKKNIWALRELIRIIDREEIEVVHCHNPNGGVLGRLAAALSRRKPYVIYTAHGFHFFRGASVINWMFYYPVEKALARLSDVIITINQEDYSRAETFHYKKDGGAQIIPGVGVDMNVFHPKTEQEKVQAAELRRCFGIPEDAFHIVSAGELNKNKNHRVVIEALAGLSRDDIYYSICGEGPYRQELEKLIKKLGLSDRVFLRGYRNDMPLIWHTADLSIFPSYREGMGMAALEAMASGVPLIAADNRGTREYLTDHENGLVCHADSPEEFADAILTMYQDHMLRTRFADNGRMSARRFTIQKTESRMREIYQRLPVGELETGALTGKRPVISVIMGVYNQLDLDVFEKAVDSVLNQTYRDFEFLIYNDGSSVEEVNRYINSLEKKDPRICVMSSPRNYGLGYALNRCIDEAKGKYLARMDADDISHPDRFAVEVDFLEKHPEYMWCGSNCELFDQKGIWGDSARPENPDIHDYLKYSPYIHPTVMYRSSLFEAVAGYAEEKKTARCEDYELFMRLFKMGYKGYNIQEPLLNYRVDRKRYHSRPFRDCWRESKVRYEGYKSLGVLWPEGWMYVLRPLASVVVPKKIVMWHKEHGMEL